MTQVIQIKRSTTTASPTTLANGELAYSQNTQKLFIGRPGGASGDIDVVGGKLYTDMLDHTAGTLTASSALLVDASSKIDVLNVDNLTLDGNTLSTTDTNGDLTLQPDGVGDIILDAGQTTITGNLTVQGTTTTVNSETVTIADNIIVLNSNEVSTPTENAGIEVERGTSTNTSLRWNETSEIWEFTNDGTTYNNMVTTANIQSIVTGGSNTNISATSNGSVIDFSVATATAATLGVASFNSTEFTVTAGAVAITALDGGTY